MYNDNIDGNIVIDYVNSVPYLISSVALNYTISAAKKWRKKLKK